MLGLQAKQNKKDLSNNVTWHGYSLLLLALSIAKIHLTNQANIFFGNLGASILEIQFSGSKSKLNLLQNFKSVCISLCSNAVKYLKLILTSRMENKNSFY